MASRRGPPLGLLHSAVLRSGPPWTSRSAACVPHMNVSAGCGAKPMGLCQCGCASVVVTSHRTVWLFIHAKRKDPL